MEHSEYLRHTHKTLIKGLPVKKIVIALLTLISLTSVANAATVYVTDSIKYTLRKDENNRSKILRMVSSGTPLTVLNKDISTGYTFVRTANGTEGYILYRHVKKNPTHRWYLEKANKKLETLEADFDLAKQELTQIVNNNDQTLSSNQNLSTERDTLSQELTELRQTAANAIQLKRQRDQLQARVISVERELQQVKRKNQTLEDSANQDWFLYGGILSLFGVMLGFILPKLSWRKRTSNWDTF